MLLVLAQHRKDVDYVRAWEPLAIAEAKIASMDSATSSDREIGAVRSSTRAATRSEAAALTTRQTNRTLTM